jgi:hypothetical protein
MGRKIPGAASGLIRRSILEYRGNMWAVVNDWFFGYTSIDYDWSDTNDVNRLTKWLMAADGVNASAATVNPATHRIAIQGSNVSGSQYFSNLREVFVVPETTTWGIAHVQAEIYCGSDFASQGLGIKPQHGVAIKAQEDTKRRAIIVWHDVVVGNPHVVNVGVWSVNLDGSGFINRQVNRAFNNLQVSHTATAGSRTSTVVTVVTTGHTLFVGDRVNVIWTRTYSGTAMTRTGNVVSATIAGGHEIPVGGTVTVTSASDASFNITAAPVTAATATTLQWTDTDVNQATPQTGTIRDLSNDRRPASVISEIVDSTTFRYVDNGFNAALNVTTMGTAVVNRIFPYYLEVKVAGSIVTARVWQRDLALPAWDSTTQMISTDLDMPTQNYTVTAASRSANVATITTSVPHRAFTGNRVDVNLVDNTYDNGTTGGVVVAVPSSTQISYANTGADDVVGSTGTATLYGGGSQAEIDSSPTPKGSGMIGLVAAHEGWDNRSQVVYGGFFGDTDLDSTVITGPLDSNLAGINRAFTFPQTSVSVAAAPAVIASSFSLPQAVESVAAAPAAVARPFAFPQALESVAAGPAVIPLSFVLPQVTPVTAGNATALPAVLAVVASFPQAVPLADSTVSPAVIARILGFGQATENVAAGPAVVALAFGLPQAIPVTADNATVLPAVIARALSFPAAGLNVAAGPVVVARSLLFGQAVATSPALAAPAVLARSFVLPATGVVIAAAITPAAIAVLAALARPGVNVGVTPTSLALAFLFGHPVSGSFPPDPNPVAVSFTEGSHAVAFRGRIGAIIFEEPA